MVCLDGHSQSKCQARNAGVFLRTGMSAGATHTLVCYRHFASEPSVHRLVILGFVISPKDARCLGSAGFSTVILQASAILSYTIKG